MPPTIRTVLNTEYPGWKLAAVSKSVWEEFNKTRPGHHPALMPGDFDQDGKTDWAISVMLNNPGEEEEFVTVFLARPTGYEEIIVESRAPDPEVYLWKETKNFTDLSTGRAREVPQVQLIIRGGPMGDSTYVWESGAFREVPPSATPIFKE